jgi:hypothetical protein
MTTHARRIFVSYSHHDHDLTATVFTHLRGLDQFFPVELWIDTDRVRAGDQWKPEIDAALAGADLAVLLVSPHFLESRFIKHHEQPRLLKRREDKGLRLVPIMLKPCAWPTWLAATEMRPRGDRALSEIRDHEPARLDRALKEIVEEIAAILGPRDVASGTGGRDSSAVATDGDEAAAARILASTLLAPLSDEARPRFADRLVRYIRTHTNLAGEGLLNAVRFFIEYQLLSTDSPTSAPALEASLATLKESDRARDLINRLRQRGRTGDFSATPVVVTSRFFSRTNAHAPLWRRYFDAVVESGKATRETIASLASIRVKMGFLSAQSLVAGLLSRFDDDWRPVLNAYQRAIPDPRTRRGAFESLQASQWNCWLMWGPSIPVCRCEQWLGHFALQYGYGDENNSIPVLEFVAEDGVPKTLGPIASGMRAEGRTARFVGLTGRLRWGPWFLRPQSAIVTSDEPGFDVAAQDVEPIADGAVLYGVAPAQASLYDDSAPAHRHDSDGLVLELESIDGSQAETRVYFSAYLWLMILVAVPPRTASDAEIGPSLLRGKAYPAWPEGPDRRQVREARLWEDVVPVFVHANVADPDALAFQRRTLVENAVTLLRQLWERRTELFDADDVNAGIQFHVVSASDYSGCGCEVRFPPAHSLVDELRARLDAEPDRAFAEHVVLPAADGTDGRRPWGLAGYFSACHLPELIGDYYEYVAGIERSARARGRRP